MLLGHVGSVLCLPALHKGSTEDVRDREVWAFDSARCSLGGKCKVGHPPFPRPQVWRRLEGSESPLSGSDSLLGSFLFPHTRPLTCHRSTPGLGSKGQLWGLLHPLSPPGNLCGSSGCPGPVNQDGETQNRNIRLKSRTWRRGLLKERRESGSLKARLAFFCLQSLGYHLSQHKKVFLQKKSLLQEGLMYILRSKTGIRAHRIYFKCTKGCQAIRDCMKRPSKQNIRTSVNICVSCGKLNQSLIMSLWHRVD